MPNPCFITLMSFGTYMFQSSLFDQTLVSVNWLKPSVSDRSVELLGYIISRMTALARAVEGCCL